MKIKLPSSINYFKLFCVFFIFILVWGNSYQVAHAGILKDQQNQMAGTTLSANAVKALAWTRTWHLHNELWGIRDVLTDPNGNVYVAAGADINYVMTNIIAKYSPTGDQLWEYQRTVASSGSSSIIPNPHLAFDSQNNVIMTGESYTSATLEDCLITKFAPDGTVLWEKTSDVSQHRNYCGNVAIDPMDNIYVSWEVDLGTTDTGVAKYSSTGQQLWTDTFNTGNGFEFGLATHTDGSVYLLASSTTGGHDDDIVIVKYSSDGAKLWTKVYNGGGGTEWRDDWPGDLLIDSAGNAYVVGYSGVDTQSRTTHGLVTIKYSPAGTVLWTKRYDYGQPGDEGDLWYDLWPASIEMDNQGDIVIAGRNAGANYTYDYVTIKYDASGSMKWASRYNGAANCNDEASALAIDQAGNVFVAGLSESECMYLPSPVHLQIVQYDVNGVLINEDAHSLNYGIPVVSIDANENVYVGADNLLRKYAANLPNPGPGDAVYNSNLKAPKCNGNIGVCDTGETLIDGKDGNGPEPNQPNTIHDQCTDNVGPYTDYHDWGRSVDRIKIYTLDGQPFEAGKTVELEVTVWPQAYTNSPNFLTLFYASNAGNPAWVSLGTQDLTGMIGVQKRTATYVLPAGGVQAVRAMIQSTDFRQITCQDTYAYDDADDLIFTVSNTAFSKSSPANGAKGQPRNVTLAWTASAGATSYQYCYDTTNDNTCAPWVNNGNSTSKALTGLNWSTWYYWHVRAVNANGTTYSNGGATAFWSFKTRSASVSTTFNATVEDGWVLESSETSNVGGIINATQTTFNVGDGAGDKQYRSVISFNTASLPDNAVITAVSFKVMQQGVAGTNPFSTHGNLLLDIKTGAFGGSNALQLADFQAAANKSGVVIPSTPVAGWYVRNLPANALTFVNKLGVTQFRLRFALDDNDDLAADLIRFFSGNAVAANRPKLIVQYYVP